jgi:RHS repeat-associated protein
MTQKDSRLRNVFRCLSLAFVLGLPAVSAHAQASGSDAPPPVHTWVDSNGIDLISGAFFTADLQVSVGDAGQGGLSRTFFNGPGAFLPYGRDSLTGTLNSSGGGGAYTVSLGSESYEFALVGSNFVNFSGDGSTLTKTDSQTYTFVARDGTKALFNTTWGDAGGLIAANVARVTQVFKPSGEVLNYAYSTQTVQVSYATVTFVRPEAVTNNFGYEIKYLYSNAPTIAGMGYITKVIALNTAVDFCGQWDTTCTGLTVAWPTINISTNASTLVSTVTDNLGRQTTYPPFALANGTQTLIRPSGETLTIKYDASYRVISFSNGTGTWLYSYVTSGTTQTTTATDPNGHTRVVVVNTANSTVTSDTDGVGNKTSFAYDSMNRVQLITRQEGDTIGYTYDARGNVTQMVNTGKDHTSTISTSANFDATCTYPAKCNQPNWTIDGRGNETNYTYNTTTGQVLSIVQPAGANGLRPETDLTYTNQYAWYKYLDGGSVAQSPSAVSLLTKISQCATAQTCAGTANALESTFTYGLSGVANNLLLTSTTQGAGDGSLVATTQLTYDSVSNLYTVTDPLLRATRYRFDTVRQLVGVVGPDPDGAGPLHNRAVRITYECDSSIKSGCDGLVTKIEQGTVLSEADSDWPAFATLGQRAITYDGIDRKSTDILSSGSTYIAASQFSYDAANRLTCQTQRMNPNALTSLPAACSLGTQGSAGPDRITYLTYDNANKLLKTTVGYGTSVQADAETRTYGGDNEVLTRADAKGHLTTILHDTFNRIYQVEFPTPSNGTVSSTSDYEQYAYDNNGNMTQDQRRDRTLVNFGYDALNQLTSGYNGATYGYDNLGRMTSAVVSGISESFGYDALGRQTSEVGPLGTVGRKFDAVGNLTRLTYPDNYYVAYGYDAANEFTTLTDSNSTTLLQKVYDNLGRISNLTRTSGPSESRSYGPDLRLSSQAYTFTDTSKNVTYSYTYNLAGQPLTMTPNSSVYSNTTSPSATSYASDGQNRYTTVGAHTMAYDGRSNLSNDGTNGAAFDGLNRITTVNSTNLSYDALDRLYATVSGATNRLLYSGGQILAAYDGSGNLLNRYVPDLHLDQTLLWYSGSSTAVSGASWLVTNAFGSVVAGAYSGTAAVSTYDAFGVSASSGISPLNGDLGFKGMPSNGSLGIYYARARTYDAALGRFLQPDPAGYVDGLHLYSFVHNSPVNGADPLGLWDGTCATFILPDPGPTSAGFPELDIPITSTGYSPHTLCSGGGSDIGQATGGGSSTSPAQSPQPFNLKNWLCMKGNALASGADLLGSASAKLEMGGVAIGIVGAVTAQPEVAGVGVAVAATGGFGSIGAGALQFGAGLLQGFGGRGFGNSISALATLGASATVGRFFAGPAVNGYRTVSQRTTDSFLQNSAITTGGIFDTLTSFLEQLGPQQVSCP